MSAILGTSFTEGGGGGAQLGSCFCGCAGRRWPPGRRNPVPGPPDCTDDRELGPVPPSFPLRASPAPSPASGAASCTRTFLQRGCGQTRKGRSSRNRGSPAPLGPAPAPAPRAAHRPGPARPALRPRTLQSTATASGGMMSASSLLLGSSFLASFWARAELNVTFTMAGPGCPRRAAGWRRGLRG